MKNLEVKNQADNTFLFLEYDANNEWLYLNWIGYQTVDNVRKGVLEAIIMQRQYHFNKVLNDNRALIGPWEKANEWLEQVLVPEDQVLNLKYVAHVISPGIFGQLSIQNLQTRVANKIQIKLFEDINRAQEWLKQQ